MIALAWMLALSCSAQANDSAFEILSARFEGSELVVRGLPALQGPSVYRVFADDMELGESAPSPHPDQVTLVFVIDASGSAGRLLGPVQRAARVLLDRLPEAEVAIVAAGSAPRLVLEPSVDRQAFDAAWSSIEARGRSSISSGIGLALGLAAGRARPVVVVVAAGVDSQGPIDYALASAAGRVSGAPVFGFGVGNRVDMALLEDFARLCGGRATRVLTPPDLGPEFIALADGINREALLRVPLPAGDFSAVRRISVGGRAEDAAPTAVHRPRPATEAGVLCAVEGPGGDPVATLVVVEQDGQAVSAGLTGHLVPAPSGEVSVRVGTAPTRDFEGIHLLSEETRQLPEAILSGIIVRGPDLGLADGTPAAVLADGEPVCALSAGETALVLPGTYEVRVYTRPAFTSAPMTIAAGAVAEVCAPGLGTLLVDAAGPNDLPIAAAVQVFGEDGRLVAAGRTGVPLTLVAGAYEVLVSIPPGRRVPVVVSEGEEVHLPSRDYGVLVLRALGPAEAELGLPFVVRDPGEGFGLLATGRTGLPLVLESGVYAVELSSTPRFQFDRLQVRGGEVNEIEVRRFGAIYAEGPEGYRYRVLTAPEGRWAGTWTCGEQVTLLAGDYTLVPDGPEGADGRIEVSVRPGMVVKVNFPAVSRGLLPDG